MLNNALTKLQGITVRRVAKSLRFRTMFLLARFEPVRIVSAMGVHAPRRIASPRFPDVSLDDTVATLKRDGIAQGLRLAPALVAEIRAWADAQHCYGNLRKDWGFDLADRAKAEAIAGVPFTVGHFFNSQTCPAIRALVGDPFVEEVAKRYVGPHARFISGHMWWSFAGERPDSARNQYAQQFHFDLDGYRFVKFFFYLTDVDEESGPHVYVKGSHTGKKLRERFPMRRFSDREVAENWGDGAITPVVGPAGSGFIADTFGIHKGQPPRTRDRLVLEFLWGQHDYAGGDDYAAESELKLLA
jgi:hypothetical protein